MEKATQCAFQLLQNYATAIKYLSLHPPYGSGSQYVQEAIHNIAIAIDENCEEFKAGKHLPKSN